MKNHQFPTRPFRNGSKKGRFWRFLANFSIFPGGVPRFWQKRVILVEISNMKSPKTSKSPWKKGSAGAILIDFWWKWPFWLVNTQIYHIYLPLAMYLLFRLIVARKGSKSQLNTFKKWVIKEPICYCQYPGISHYFCPSYVQCSELCGARKGSQVDWL